MEIMEKVGDVEQLLLWIKMHVTPDTDPDDISQLEEALEMVKERLFLEWLNICGF